MASTEKQKDENPPEDEDSFEAARADAGSPSALPSGLHVKRMRSASEANQRAPVVFEPLHGITGTDIGGTLGKLVYLQPFSENGGSSHFLLGYEKYGRTGERLTGLQLECKGLGGTLHFIRFQSDRVEGAVALAKGAGIMKTKDRFTFHVTGGGAFKHTEFIETELGVDVVKVDELESVVQGVHFLLEHGGPDEVYAMRKLHFKEGNAERIQPPQPLKMDAPFLLVNIGSGVSMLRVLGTTSDRCGGTSQGGATFWGLCRLITSAPSFQAAMDMCARGNSTHVDKLVRDIYGGDYERHHLAGDVVASCFGKLASMEDPRSCCKEEDLALALLNMVSQQITLLAHYIALEQGCQQVVFVGGFLRFNPIAKRVIAFNFERLSRGGKALFMRHSDFVGALGALDVAIKNVDSANPAAPLNMPRTTSAPAAFQGEDARANAGAESSGDSAGLGGAGGGGP